MDFHNLAFLTVLLLSALGCCAGQEQALKPGNLDYLVGQNVSFVTTIDPLTQQFVVITWTFNSGSGPVPIISSATKGESVADAYKDRVVFNRTTGSLVLKAVTISDTGDYSISMVQDTGVQIPGENKLTVYESVSNVVATANVTNPVEFNDTVSLTCTATGSKLTYSWLSGGAALVATDHMQLSKDGSVLTILSILRADKGPFACTASNPLTTKTSSPLTFNISYGPEEISMTASPQQPVHSTKSNITLTCSAKSSPAAQYDWLFNGENLKKPGPVLTLTDIQKTQGGNYTCLASNPNTKRYLASTVAQISLMEKISGAAVTGPTANLIAGNSSANISCQAAKGTIVTTKWLKDGKPLSPSDRVTIFADKSSVGISRVEKTDSGEYQCELSNPVSTNSASYKMIVNYGPEAVAIKGVAAVEVNEKLSLTCAASSDPPATYTWTVNGTVKDVKKAVYELEKAAYVDSGKYECVASNNVTGKTASAVHTLSVKEKIEEGLSGGAIAGIVIAVLVALLIIALIARCMTKKKKVTESPY
ncbi:carcinoembryonic antigen-related cell adhesion molecule 5 [Anguilla anguilla]|uniref:carcinoembryonic antigen-related cell adhesion molecule 5 n=1 Tax=Anguilla anguilla TaxID=7936 RepID=UPI0015B014A7|nr:carcinoembryonic antigen-related cell adhesion molecule 5 [Anguilla anguilla]XP_035286579.1 carcinoembryonic antigen-related cell adhesion molecule 5 [Anguilla anguilla]